MRGSGGYHKLGRRDLVLGGGMALVGCLRGAGPPVDVARVRRAAGTPEPRWGVQTGDVSPSRAVVWSRSDRPAQMVTEWSTSPAFTDARCVLGPEATFDTDLTAKLALDGLPPATRIHYRVRFEAERASEWETGSLSTAPLPTTTAPADVVFAWSADTNGQGWGIDPARGGMPAFTALLERAPDLFIGCGDAIYADVPIPPEIALPDGGVWRNLVTPAKSHVAETLDDFRGAYLYSRHSREVRALSARVPSFSIWDDHEVRNNWFPGEMIPEEALRRAGSAEASRRERSIDVLAIHARRAMIEHAPTLLATAAPAPMYRSVRWGPLLEIFLLDGRTFRTANYPAPPEQAFLGAVQLAWLEDALARSTATWKVIACDMPIGLVVSEPAPGSGEEAFDGFANTSGPPSGRELELARLLASLRRRAVRNVVWLTADVHYAAAHRYDPSRAAFRDMDPFYEFVAGPMHATSYPRKRFDDTFGPELVYASAGWDTFGSPADGAQYFGVVRIDGRSRVMTVTLVDGRGRDLHTTELRPEA
jgi:alkaline phosphatase D